MAPPQHSEHLPRRAGHAHLAREEKLSEGKVTATRGEKGAKQREPGSRPTPQPVNTRVTTLLTHPVHHALRVASCKRTEGFYRRVGFGFIILTLRLVPAYSFALVTPDRETLSADSILIRTGLAVMNLGSVHNFVRRSQRPLSLHGCRARQFP